MKCYVDSDYGWTPEGYDLDDSNESEIEWEKIKDSFRATFSEYSENEDYEFADWHYNTRCIFLCLYSDSFYVSNTLERIISFLRGFEKWFARFECYQNESKLIGDFMVVDQLVYFSEFSRSNELPSLLNVEIIEES